MHFVYNHKNTGMIKQLVCKINTIGYCVTCLLKHAAQAHSTAHLHMLMMHSLL